MKPQRWQQINSYYNAALEMRPEKRLAYLEEACRGDGDLRREVEALLSCDDKAGKFMDAPAMEVAGRALARKTTEARQHDLVGRTLHHYRMEEKIGEGGMGEVYRARDTKLGREVAIKVLPPALAGDPERLARFQREARVLASLNHPHIAAIHGLEESNGVHALVLELVEGPTLADRIGEGPIPLKKALPLARQMAEALEYAHEKGIVHRDLKPANVKLSADGNVKVLDFGLAKALDDDRTTADPEHSPTQTIGATRAGVIIGTAAYMSPEQAHGREADRRGDIWSFGAVLYEMLAGQPAFTGESISDTLASVLKVDPDWDQLPGEVPPSVRRLLRRCLTKDRRDRLQAIGEARIAIKEQLADPTGAPVLVEAPVIAQPPARQRVWPWVAGLLAVALVVSLAGWWQGTRAVEQPLMQFNVDLGSEVALDFDFGASAIVSPDGTRLVYVSRGPDGQTMLYTRELAQPQATALSGTEDARSPFFSPDGQWVGFFTYNELKKISVQGGAAVTLCATPSGKGGSWGEDGNIIAALGPFVGLSRVSSAGGTPEPVTELNEETGETSHRWPQLLPGGKSVLFTAGTRGAIWDDASIEVQSLETDERKTLQRGGSYGRYLPSGHLVYVRQGALFAAPMDIDRLELTGAPAPVLENVAVTMDGAGAQFDFSETGMFIYLGGDPVSSKTTIHWLDHTGRTEPLLATPGRYMTHRLSPDGRRLALVTGELSNSDIWVYDWDRDTMSRLTFAPGEDSHPVWTPDGKYIAFRSARDGGAGNIYLARADGSGEAQRLTEDKYLQLPFSFSPAGKRLAFHELSAATAHDIWTLPLEGSGSELLQLGRAEPFLHTTAHEVEPVFSPDGRWLAYSSTESGAREVYVRPFPGPGGVWQISNGGGWNAIWSPNGRELFYGNPNNQIMVTAYTADGDSFRAGTPRLWSETRFYSTSVFEKFDLAPDGKRFAILVAEDKAAEQEAPTRVTVLLNFFDELRRKVPPGSTAK